MKATFLLENLLGKLSFLNHAVSSRPQLPILSAFLLRAGEGKLKILATDLEIGISTIIPASVGREGEVAVLAKPLSEFLGSVSEEKITIEKKENALEIKGAKTKASFNTMGEADFPRIFDEKGESIITIKKNAIIKELGRVVFAASTDSDKPAFSGVLVKKEEDRVLFVATDSHRLSLNKSRSIKDANAGLKKPILVSSRTLRALLASKEEGDVEVFLSEKNNQVIFSQDETTLVGRLIEAEYPDFEKIIPNDFSTKAEFDREELLGALKATSIFSRDNANIVKMSIKKEGISLLAKSPTIGENTVEVGAKISGEENEIAFNSRYLLDLLQNLDDETMVFEMAGPLNPGVFKIANDDSFIHLIMPIRVRDEELRG